MSEFSPYKAAQFWESHDREDFADEGEEIKVKVARPLKMIYTIRLAPDRVEGLGEIISEKGVGPITLIRMWILEELKEVEGTGLTPRTSLSKS